MLRAVRAYSTRRLLQVLVFVLTMISLPSGGSAAPLPGEEPVLWFFQVMGREESATQRAAEAALFDLTPMQTAERSSWAVVRGGKLAAASIDSEPSVAKVLGGGEPIDFFPPKTPNAYDALRKKFLGAQVRDVFIEGEAPAGMALGRRIAFVADPAVAEVELAKHDLIVAQDVKTLEAVARKAPGKLVFLRRSKTPLLAMAELDLPLRSMRIFHNVPTTGAEAVAIHGAVGAGVSTEALADLHRALRSVIDKDIASVVDLGTTQEGTIADRLRTELDASAPDEMRIILGHVERGAIVFQDGSATLLGDLTSRPRVSVMGCNSADHAGEANALGVGTIREISYAEGVATAREIKVALKRGTEKNPATTRTVLRSLADTSKGAEIVTVGIAGELILIQVRSPRPKEP